MVACFSSLMRTVILFVIVTFIPSLAWCEIKAHLEVTPSEGTVDDEYTMSIVIEGAELSNPIVSKSPDWRIQHSGTNSQILQNGRSLSVTVSHRYSLLPLHAGELVTPAAKIVVEGKAYDLPPKTIKVSINDPSLKSNSESKDLFVNQLVSKDAVFKGEQLSSTLQVYTRLDLAEVQLSNPPIDGAWQEPLGQEENFRKLVNGIPYSVIQIRKALYPLKSGPLILPKRELTAKTPMEGSDDPQLNLYPPLARQMMKQFMGATSYKEVRVTSNEPTVTVKDLPLPPPDLHISNQNLIVGETQIEVKGDSSSVAVGNTKHISVTVTSLGNINPLKDISIPPSPEYQVYDDSPQIKSFENNNQLVSQKTFTFSIVPLLNGEITIPSITLPYFDPAEEKYRVAKTKSLSFTATGIAPQRSIQPEVSLIPTSSITPTPKATPTPLAYEPPSLGEQISDTVSLSAIIWLLTLLGCLVGIVLWIRRTRIASGALMSSPNAFKKAQTPEDLYLALQTFFKERHGIAIHHIIELRAAAQKLSLTGESRYLFLEALDELDLALRHRQALDAGTFDGLKVRLSTVLER